MHINYKQLSLIIVLLFLPLLVFSHGINYEIISEGIIIKTFFSEEKVFANAGVKVFSPDNYLDPYKIATTDENGVYIFTPDKPGDWVIFFRDDEGHGTRVNLTIDKNLMIANSNLSSNFSLIQIIVMVICVLFGLAGIISFFIKRKK